MGFVVVQRSQILAQRFETRLDRCREFRAARRRDIRNDARQTPSRLSRIFEMRSPLAPSRRSIERRSAFSWARVRRSAAADRPRPEQPVRQEVQFGRDTLENICNPVDDRLDQPDKDLGRAASRGTARRSRTSSASRSAPLPAVRAPARSRPGSSGVLDLRAVDQRRTQAQHVAIGTQPARQSRFR